MKYIRKLHDLFIAHPKNMGQSYFQHMLMAMSFVVQLLFTALVLFVHALLPFLFKSTASNKILKLANVMKSRKNYK